jgi:hypothetical protein
MLLQSKEGHLPLEKQIYHIYYPDSKKTFTSETIKKFL